MSKTNRMRQLRDHNWQLLDTNDRLLVMAGDSGGFATYNLISRHSDTLGGYLTPANVVADLRRARRG